MTNSVLPPFSSKVTVVTGPPSPPSSLVQTRRECGVTTRYVPKNAIPSGSNSSRYLPPTRTSISQERRDIPIDFGSHHRLNRSGLVHASNTRRAGTLKVRVTTISSHQGDDRILGKPLVGSSSFAAFADEGHRENRVECAGRTSWVQTTGP